MLNLYFGSMRKYLYSTPIEEYNLIYSVNSVFFFFQQSNTPNNKSAKFSNIILF
jgi:hypothetical protein